MRKFMRLVIVAAFIFGIQSSAIASPLPFNFLVSMVSENLVSDCDDIATCVFPPTLINLGDTVTI